MKKRILSMVAVLAMVFSMMPQAFAEDAALALNNVMNVSNQVNVSDTMQLGENVALSKTFKGLSTINEFVSTSENDFIEYKVDFGTGLTDGLNKLMIANVRARAQGQIVVTRPVQSTDAEGTTEITIATIDVKPMAADVGKTNYDGIAVISLPGTINRVAQGNANLKGEQIIRVTFVGDEVDFCRLYELQFVSHVYSNDVGSNGSVAWSECTKGTGATKSFTGKNPYVAWPVYFTNGSSAVMNVDIMMATTQTSHNILLNVRLDHPEAEPIAEYLYDTQNTITANWNNSFDIVFPVKQYISGAHLVYLTFDINNYDGTTEPYGVANNPATDFYNFKFLTVANDAEDTSDDFVVNTVKQSHHWVKTNSFAEKDYMKTLVRFDKNATIAEKVMLVAALYDENNKLISVNTKMHDVVEGLNAVEVETKWQDAKNAGAGDYTWKAFIWDGTTLSPVAGTAKNLGTVTIAEEVVEEE